MWKTSSVEASDTEQEEMGRNTKDTLHFVPPNWKNQVKGFSGKIKNEQTSCHQTRTKI